MSLIQEALEKANKPKLPENSFELPAFTPPAEKKNHASRVSLPQIKIHIPKKVLVRAGMAISAILLFWGIAFILNRAGKSSVMVTGVPSVISQSSVIPTPVVPKFVLTGVTYSGKDRLALINDQVVGVGDRLQEKAFVKEIGEKYVVLDYERKEIKLTL